MIERKLFFLRIYFTGSRPNLNEHSRSIFFENLCVRASLSPHGSDHSKSQRNPYSGGSINLSILFMSSTEDSSGDSTNPNSIETQDDSEENSNISSIDSQDNESLESISFIAENPKTKRKKS